MTEEANSLRNMENAIYNSSKRDITFSRLFYRSINWTESIKRRKIITRTDGKIEDISLNSLTKSGRGELAKYFERQQECYFSTNYILSQM